VALADAAPDATSLPVIGVRLIAALVGTLVTLASRPEAQRHVLSFGLKAGHHVGRTRQLGSSGRSLTLWAPGDSGRFPLLVLVPNGRSPLDTVLPEYLATHGFVVVLAGSRGGHAAADGLRLAHGLSFVDTTRVAVAQWGSEQGATAILDFDPADGESAALVIRAITPGGSDDARLRISRPRSPARPGSEARRIRLLCAVTHAVLDSVLRYGGSDLPALAARLRATGLVTQIVR